MANWLSYILSWGQGPNPRAERRVRTLLKGRPCLSRDEWFDQHWRPKGIRKIISDHVYEHFDGYSGMPVGCMLPTDTLFGNLEFQGVCWSDWEFDHWEEFQRQFGVCIVHSYPEVNENTTLAEIMNFLNAAVPAEDRIG